MKKRLIAAILSFVMAFTMSACPETLAAKKNAEKTNKEQRSMIGMYGNNDGFLLSDGIETAKVYVDKAKKNFWCLNQMEFLNIIAYIPFH